jgi:hypothetical protein
MLQALSGQALEPVRPMYARTGSSVYLGNINAMLRTADVPDCWQNPDAEDLFA